MVAGNSGRVGGAIGTRDSSDIRPTKVHARHTTQEARCSFSDRTLQPPPVIASHDCWG
jgi:hypothetical protein